MPKMKDDRRLESKVAVITGSTAGIGKETALLFAEHGAKVVISGSGRNPDAGQAVVEEIRNRGGTAQWCKADLRKRSEIEQLVDYAVHTFGGLDILMNNAYVGNHGTATTLDEESWDASYTLGVKAVFLACKAAIPIMLEQGGGIVVNVSSTHGLLGSPGFVSYDSVKAATLNLTRQLAVEYGRQGIRVNAILPGRIITEEKQRFLDSHPEEYRRQRAFYPLGRAGRPDEVAYAALFLASDESSFVTGHGLVVDGGLTSQLPDAVAKAFEKGISEELSQRGVRWP